MCELTGKIIRAIIGRVIDASGPQQGQLKRKLAQHKSRLGPNYREVLAFLDEPKPKGGRNARSKKPAAAGNGTKKDDHKRSNGHKSTERVEDEDDEIEDDGPDERHNVEEDEEEYLRAKGLIEDDEDIDKNNEDGNEDGNHVATPDPDEDEVMGD